MGNGELSSKQNIVCSGALFYSKTTKRFLLLQKSTGKHQGTWGLVGGTSEPTETPWEALQREIKEEIRDVPTIIKTIPLETFISNDGVFNFHTYLCIVTTEFIPTLSNEHCGWGWTTLDNAPKPLHQGLKTSFNNRIVRAKLQTIFDIAELIN
jgi:8-oxo-dGTP pyrophosphatase MutT (NUDIX family)